MPLCSSARRAARLDVCAHSGEMTNPSPDPGRQFLSLWNTLLDQSAFVFLGPGGMPDS